jgi:type 1 glutamine amidotransferase
MMIASFQCQDNQKVKTLIISGGHEFEREAFFAMFDSFKDVAYREITHPQANQAYGSKMMDSVDVLIFYDMVQEISAPEKAALISLLEKGKGLLFLHHSLASYQNWDEFIKIIGGKYHLKKEGDSAGMPESNYKHDVDVPVTVIDKNHPITEGVSDFVIHDEIYGNYTVLPGVYPLLMTDHPQSGDVLCWINHYKNSWIVYLQLGHDHFAYENPNYRRLVGQSIRWLANPSTK